MRASGAPSASTVARVIASAAGPRARRARTSRRTARSDRPRAPTRSSGGMSGRRGIAASVATASTGRFYNEPPRAISSVGQSASLIRRRSLVRVQDRPSPSCRGSLGRSTPPGCLAASGGARSAARPARIASSDCRASCGSSACPTTTSKTRNSSFQGSIPNARLEEGPVLRVGELEAHEAARVDAADLELLGSRPSRRPGTCISSLPNGICTTSRYVQPGLDLLALDLDALGATSRDGARRPR